MDLREGLSGPKLSKKSQKKSPGPGSQQSEIKSRKNSKSLQELRLWRPSKEVPKPRPGKCRKSASESAGPKRGAEGSAEKSAPGSVSL